MIENGWLVWILGPTEDTRKHFKTLDGAIEFAKKFLADWEPKEGDE